MLKTLIKLFLLLGLCACGPSSDRIPGVNTAPAAKGPVEAASNEIETLKVRIAALEAENLALRATPEAMLAEVMAAAGELALMTKSVEALAKKYPGSEQAGLAAKRLSQAVTQQTERDAQAQRIAALGLKALPVQQRVVGNQATVEVAAPAISRRWTFDSYDDSYHYRAAEKGSSMVVAKVAVHSKEKNPSLPGIALYAGKGAEMRRVATFDLRFTRWKDFATYLGNYTDYGNDFSHSNSIPMTAAADIQDVQLIKPLFIVVAKEGCYERSEERFTQPPVSYNLRQCASLKETLSAGDFADGALTIARRID